MEPVDVCIIGAGPGGYVAAIRAAQLGMKVALVEREELGGVCLNKGCIPTKALLRTAELLAAFRRAADWGIHVENVRLDYPAAVQRRDAVVRSLRQGVAGLLKSQGVQVLAGQGRLQGPRTVEVTHDGTTQTVEARHIVVATGSAPAIPPIPGADNPALVITSDDALALRELPRSIVVVGGGAVGAEWADIFHTFGCEVTLLEMMPTLLPTEDEEIGRTLARVFTRRGIKVLTGARVLAIETGANGGAVVHYTADGREATVEGERVLMGVGRKPLTAALGLEAVGVRLDQGWIPVDDSLQTNVPGIYAIGDVTRHQLLAHVASHQGIVAVERMAGYNRRVDYNRVPNCIFTHPEVASVGLTEARAREAGYRVRVGRFPLAALGRAQTHGETEGLVKVVADERYGEILGVHIVAAAASDMIAEATLAMQLEATVDELAQTIHAHPTWPEALAEAALATKGLALHLLKPRELRE
ncbi:MAG TPA: dihydrolipoyl dehydrogenase [Chloroflexota bacterium]|nr:dihydrolipoyl dehydrogenase [Chloroflexota bacterium]